MKKIETKSLTKQIICIIIVLMLCNFIIPNYTYALNDDDQGGDLLEAIAQLLCFVPDVVLGTLQNMLVTSEKLEVKDRVYSINYSPAIIFSGAVPAFDVDFISPDEETINMNSIQKYIEKNEETYRTTQSVETEVYEQNLNALTNRGYDGVMPEREYMFSYDYRSTLQYDIYYYIDDQSTEETADDVLVVETFGEYGTKVGDELVRRNYVYSKHENNINDEEVKSAIDLYESTAIILQPVISTWYNVLRRIALVGLLSALVYIGIRVVLTSTFAKDKAKYKNMLKDWLIACCILFTLHYIMSITVAVVDNINMAIQASTIGANGEDVLMTTLRNEIANADDWGEVLVQVVLYFVLGVYTIIFTVQYFRRTIYIAFLTVIAPLITLTYPLDKIKDKKSQAFDMWIKDYIFFMLLQVVHLLIYYILVGSSMNLANEQNWVFAIVAIGFLIPAEKIVKNMFGFNKSKTMGALAAGATGALVMNAMNKLSQIVPKGKKEKSSAESSEEESNNKVRIATNNSIETSKEKKDSAVIGGVAQGGTTVRTSNLVNTDPSDETNLRITPNLKSDKPNILGGAKSLAGRYILTGENIKKIGKATLGGLLGGTGAMIGFASGVAQGDLGKALTGVAAGGTAGSALGKGIVDFGSNVGGKIKNTVNDVTDTWNEGAYGKEYAENVKMIREFKQTSDYKALKEKYGADLSDEKLSEILQAAMKEKKDGTN